MVILICYLFLKAYWTSDHLTHLFKVYLMMKLTYRTLPNDDENDGIQHADAENAESETMPDGGNRNRKHWDDDCPWSEWYSAEDPVKGNLIFVMLIFLY